MKSMPATGLTGRASSANVVAAPIVGLAAASLRGGLGVTRPSTGAQRMTAAVPAPSQFSTQDLTVLAHVNEI